MSKQTFTIGMTGANLVSYLNANFTEVYNGHYIKSAVDYGLSAAGTAAANVTALKLVVTGGGTIFIKKGTYKVDETIYLESNTAIICEPGTIFQKDDAYCCVFSNVGAKTKTLNENIIIDGLEVSVNGQETYNLDVLGLNAHMGFHYVKNLQIKNFICEDGGTILFMFYMINWENVLLENIYIDSDKDGINFGTGHNALIKNVILETADDGSALACVGFPVHTIEVGDIYDIKYENVIDRTGVEDEGGFLCRAMTASWDDWTNGNTYQTGDLALNAGHLYQVTNAAVFSAVGANAPVHHSGEVTGADTITWKYLNDTAEYHADVYNISIVNCTQTKLRTVFHANMYIGNNLRAVYPGTETLSAVYNILIDGGNFVHAANTIYLVRSDGNLRDVRVVNNTLDNVRVYYNPGDVTLVSTLLISLTGNVFKNICAVARVEQNAEAVTIITAGNSFGALFATLYTANGSTIRMIGVDLPLSNTHRASYLTPTVGDVVHDDDGFWVYKAAGWANLAT